MYVYMYVCVCVCVCMSLCVLIRGKYLIKYANSFGDYRGGKIVKEDRDRNRVCVHACVYVTVCAR